MAVESTMVNTSLSIRYKDGIDTNGRDINKVKKYTNVKINAVNQNLFDVAAAFGTLLRYPILDVVKTDESLITSL